MQGVHSSGELSLTVPSNSDDLAGHLRSVFGFECFRAGQEAVCRAAIEGRDLLLVMPTGAGKSLCYQLPAIARGGTAVVISPLIALMEDQAAKLAALGLRVARVHSGLERTVARQACADYLNGSLQFLFIAPERLRVPGFVEMLAKRKLALIAIDEAHCISQWGHDFRPDYRMLGQYLPVLRAGNSDSGSGVLGADGYGYSRCAGGHYCAIGNDEAGQIHSRVSAGESGHRGGGGSDAAAGRGDLRIAGRSGAAAGDCVCDFAEECRAAGGGAVLSTALRGFGGGLPCGTGCGDA